MKRKVKNIITVKKNYPTDLEYFSAIILYPSLIGKLLLEPLSIPMLTTINHTNSACENILQIYLLTFSLSIRDEQGNTHSFLI